MRIINKEKEMKERTLERKVKETANNGALIKNELK